jgi:serine/threonine protein kinase
MNPIVVHKNLKPENILLKEFCGNIFVKLSDYDSINFSEFVDKTHEFEEINNRYTALEVKNSTEYSIKSDIFSLGIILHELFNINLNR